MENIEFSNEELKTTFTVRQPLSVGDIINYRQTTMLRSDQLFAGWEACVPLIDSWKSEYIKKHTKVDYQQDDENTDMVALIIMWVSAEIAVYMRDRGQVPPN